MKPFSSLARFELIEFLGSKKVKIEVGEKKVKIGPTEWLLDCLFRPELAHQLPVFRVDDTYLLKGIGIEGKERRARLSFRDFEVVSETNEPDEIGKPAWRRLFDQVGEISERRMKEEKRRKAMTPKQIREEEYAKTSEERDLEEKQKEKEEFYAELAGLCSGLKQS